MKPAKEDENIEIFIKRIESSTKKILLENTNRNRRNETTNTVHSNQKIPPTSSSISKSKSKTKSRPLDVCIGTSQQTSFGPSCSTGTISSTSGRNPPLPGKQISLEHMNHTDNAHHRPCPNTENIKNQEELIHESLKQSPFFAAWKSWSEAQKEKQGLHSVEQENDAESSRKIRSLTNPSWSIHQILKKRHYGTKTLKYGTVKRTTKAKVKEKKMLELNSSALRWKYRSFENRPFLSWKTSSFDTKEKNVECKSADLPTEFSLVTNHSLEDIVDTSSRRLREPHPLHTLLKAHIDSENEKLRIYDQQETIQHRVESLLDEQATWHENMGLLQDIIQKEKNRLGLDELDPTQTKLDVQSILSGSTQIQSVSIPWATQKLYQHKGGQYQYSARQQDVPTLPMEGTDSLPEITTCPVEHPNEKYRLGPEINYLIACEPLPCSKSKDTHLLPDSSTLLSIFQVRDRTMVSDDWREIKKGLPFWVIEFYNLEDCSEEIFFADESKMVRVIESLPLHKVMIEPIRKELVFQYHVESSKNDVLYEMQTNFSIYVENVGRRMTTSIHIDVFCLMVKDGNDEHGREPIKTILTLPVFVIISRLRKHYLCKALDVDFWYSSSNEDFIWKPLLQMININFDATKSTGSVSWSWAQQHHDNETFDVMLWEQPSVPCNDENYFSILHSAYQLLFYLHEGNDDWRSLDFLHQDLVDSIQQRHNFARIWNESETGIPPLALRLTGANRIFSKCAAKGSCIIDTFNISAALKHDTVEISENQCEKSDETDSVTTHNAHVAAIFESDTTTKPFPSPTVRMSIAFEDPIFAPKRVAFDSDQIIPPPPSPLPLDESALDVMISNKALETEPFDSEIDKRKPSTIIILDPAGDKSKPTKHVDGSRRHVPTFNEESFRVKCLAHSFCPKNEFHPQPFYISKNGATPNKTVVHPPTILHSEDLCMEPLYREQEPREFYDFLREEHPDPFKDNVNEPLLATVRLTGYSIKSVVFTPLNEFIELERSRASFRELCGNVQYRDDVIKNNPCSLSPCEEQDLLQQEVSSGETRYECPSTDCNEMKSYTYSVYTERLEEHRSEWSDNQPYIMACAQPELFSKPGTARIVGIVDPVKTNNISYQRDEKMFQIKLETKVVENVLEDRVQLARAREIQKRYQDLILTAPQQEALEHILRIPLGDNLNTVKNHLTVDSVDRNERFRSENFDTFGDLGSLSLAEKEYRAM